MEELICPRVGFRGLEQCANSRVLGHADTAATERYAHFADDHVRRAAGRISGIVHDALTGRPQGGQS